MKRLVLWAIPMAILTLAACKKFDHPFPGHLPKCQITKLKIGVGPEDSMVITYNNKGNPVSMIRTVTGTSTPNFFFRYDKRNRVTDVIGIYDDGVGFETWHRLYYDHRDRIIRDTTYDFGIVGETPQPIPGRDLIARNISTFEYDAHNRIIRSTDTYGGSPDMITTTRYIYNSAGNLGLIVTSRGDAVDSFAFNNYDNKMNMHLTHPIWQYLDRDYSLNNSFTAASYNSRGLPVLLDVGKNYGMFAQVYFYERLEIVYKCR